MDTPTGGVETLSDGSIVVAGLTTSGTNISTPGASQEELNDGSFYAFLSRFSITGELMWSTYLGPPTDIMNTYSEIREIVVLPNNDIVAAGVTLSPEFPVSEEAMQTDHQGGWETFICRFNSDGEMLWSTFFGGPEDDVVYSVDVDSQGDIVMLGYTESETGIATTGGHQEQYEGDQDLFIVKYTGNGTIEWSTYLGGGAEEAIPGESVLTVGEDNNIYFAASTESELNMATVGAHQTEILGDEDPLRNVIIGKFSPEGEYIWGTYFGSFAFTIAKAIDFRSGSLIVAGNSSSSDDHIIEGEPWQANSLGMTSSNFLASFSTDGQQEWGTYYGGEDIDFSRSLVAFSDGTLAITGSSQSETGIATPDGFQSNNQGIDGFFSFFQINFETGFGEREELLEDVMSIPNPARQQVRLQLPPSFSFRADVTVYDLSGKAVATHPQFNSLESLPLPHTPGMYVECRNKGEVVRSKVVVE